jgi:acetyl/propionyl-CoA carboxylase alpha subunit
MRTLFVANRAEIALRVLRTARALGYRTAAAASPADRHLPYAAWADRLVEWDGSSEVGATYLDADKVVAAAIRAGADAVHPGYGFLSENARFAEAVEAAGLVWIGPPPSAIRAMGDKAAARKVAEQYGVPVVPGHSGSQDPDALVAAARAIGFPVLIKAVAGGGGRGMRRVDEESAFLEALAGARREAKAAFGDDAVIVERYVRRPRHVEVQVMGDRHGNVVSLGERECSIQRRHQKVVEEAPSPAVSEAMRAAMGEAAVRVAKAVGYQGAGTVEFIVEEGGSFYFLEMNTRLQVEHPVTECVTGLDLVELQLRVAEGERAPWGPEPVALRGHAIEVRLYAEDPLRGYLPGTGPLHRVDLPAGEGVRIDAGYATGDQVSPHYDAMLAKLIAYGPDRRTATRRLARAVEDAWVPGVVTNLPLLRQILAHPLWDAADLDTAFLERAGLPVAPPLNLERGAIAATVLAVHQRRSALPGPAGWRVFGRAEQVDTWRCGNETARVAWTPTADGAVVNGQRVVVLAQDGDQLTVSVDGLRQRWRLAWIPADPTHRAIDDGDLVYVHLGDGEAFVQLEPRFPERAAAAGDPGDCTAPTPGKVVAVHVVVGDLVEAGQKLVTLEAMKMEHPVTAPEAGVVSEIRVAVGDTVEEGAHLARITPPADASE